MVLLPSRLPARTQGVCASLRLRDARRGRARLRSPAALACIRLSRTREARLDGSRALSNQTLCARRFSLCF
eukprot:2369989-Pleurochrysis_carterae.AAC.1